MAVLLSNHIIHRPDTWSWRIDHITCGFVWCSWAVYWELNSCVENMLHSVPPTECQQLPGGASLMYSNAMFDYLLIMMRSDSTSVEMFEYSRIHQDRRRWRGGTGAEVKELTKVCNESQTDWQRDEVQFAQVMTICVRPGSLIASRLGCSKKNKLKILTVC